MLLAACALFLCKTINVCVCVCSLRSLDYETMLMLFGLYGVCTLCLLASECQFEQLVSFLGSLLHSTDADIKRLRARTSEQATKRAS